MEGNSVSKTQRSSTRRDADEIEQVREILWPHDDPQRQWTPDTLDRIAEVVRPDRPPIMNKPKRVSDVELRALYGKSMVISRKALFTLVHLDNPSPEVVRQRGREFDPATFFLLPRDVLAHSKRDQPCSVPFRPPESSHVSGAGGAIPSEVVGRHS